MDVPTPEVYRWYEVDSVGYVFLRTQSGGGGRGIGVILEYRVEIMGMNMIKIPRVKFSKN